MNRFANCALIFAFLCTYLLLCSAEAGTEIEGNIGLEFRAFAGAPAYSEQAWHNGSLFGKLNYNYTGQGWSFNSNAFARADTADSERSRLDLREACFAFRGNGYYLRVGVDKVFWGVTESRHLVDIINQSDLADSYDGETKLGQPMLRFTAYGDWGSLDTFLLPVFRERPFPGINGRLRPAIPIESEARYESSEGCTHLDFALRYSRQAGRFDVGISGFVGTNREPALLPTIDAGGALMLQPYYSQIRQVSVDAQYTVDAWLWKLEGLYRTGELNLSEERESYQAVVAGVEYTFFDFNGADIGLLMELLCDSRDDRATTPFEHDIFLGMRLVLNDVANSQCLVGLVSDLITSETLWRVEGSRRLGQNWTIEVEGLSFVNIESTSTLFDLRSDSYMGINFIWWF